MFNILIDIRYSILHITYYIPALLTTITYHYNIPLLHTRYSFCRYSMFPYLDIWVSYILFFRHDIECLNAWMLSLIYSRQCSLFSIRFSIFGTIIDIFAIQNGDISIRPSIFRHDIGYFDAIVNILNAIFRISTRHSISRHDCSRFDSRQNTQCSRGVWGR